MFSYNNRYPIIKLWHCGAAEDECFDVCLYNLMVFFQVTGRVIKTGSMTGLKDVLALPDLSSRARCPRFQYKYVINKNQVTTDVNMILLLRVYTVDRISGELKVIGSCLSPVYSKQTVSFRMF